MVSIHPAVPTPIAATGAPIRLRLLIAYDGAPFRGFAENRGVDTVASTLRSAIERVVGHGIDLAVAGRTDAGVHGWGQVVSFDLDPSSRVWRRRGGLQPEAFARAITRLAGPSVVVRRAEVAPPGFHARHSATARRYRYHLWTDPAPNPFLADTHWHVPDRLDPAALANGTLAVLGAHDFSSFCRRPPDFPDGPASLVREVRAASWTPRGPARWRFEIEASAFCHQMVRSVVGLLVDVGRGRRRAVDVAAALAARDRAAAGPVAPPHGLVLWHVTYPPDPDGTAAFAVGDRRP